MGAPLEASCSDAAGTSSSQKRKATDFNPYSKSYSWRHEPNEEEEEEEEEEEQRPTKSRKTAEPTEKRLRRFRPKAPKDFHIIYHRATNQKFFVLERTRMGTDECPEETVELTGSTGNVYHVHISQNPSCDCFHAQKGNQCKHIIYVMSRVLRARYDLVYQLALLPSELRSMFSRAPPIIESPDQNRKSLDDDCPICFSPFEDDDAVYCRATCGQNIHRACFEMWAATKRKSARDTVTCPMCRTPWQGDDDMVKKIKNTGVIGPEGYVNLAGQLGISRVRDHSTYYGGPRRYGFYEDEDY
ncbi:uncharacterized protein GGS25DRAFT_524851 [Hypoxylon fragiforme]|uniref:uncharacterized protein n=1 Tax=Hypoxylon fragiforme TaxID=63214 RepID=UPI0020C62814|nr:uncharacterized protein GGS25DRAFT_524851 [Hypoxylon fragiforme]KAI2605336.1 hypothetical protein GGS25DRAFT_524851 [Hypoxylon fragiforme]